MKSEQRRATLSFHPTTLPLHLSPFASARSPSNFALGCVCWFCGEKRTLLSARPHSFFVLKQPHFRPASGSLPRSLDSHYSSLPHHLSGRRICSQTEGSGQRSSSDHSTLVVYPHLGVCDPEFARDKVNRWLMLNNPPDTAPLDTHLHSRLFYANTSRTVTQSRIPACVLSLLPLQHESTSLSKPHSPRLRLHVTPTQLHHSNNRLLSRIRMPTYLRLHILSP